MDNADAQVIQEGGKNNATTLSDSLAQEAAAGYQDRWESRSSIRTSPRKAIDFSKQGFFFPPKKQPLLLLPEIKQLGEEVKKQILVYSFYKYLNDIVNLEIHLINKACYNIIYGDLVVKYDEMTKLVAHTIIIDEHYHVYIARDIIRQLGKHFTELDRLEFPASDAYNAIIEINQRLNPKYRDVFCIIAVCLFETTVIKELIQFFSDKEVHPSIRFYVNDHMNDESRHNGFFLTLLTNTWGSLPDEYRQVIGRQLADFVKLYLNIESEKKYNKLLLRQFLKNISDSALEDMLGKLYKNFSIVSDIPVVKNILSVLKNAKIMDCEFVKNAFAEHDLYDKNL